MQVINLDVEAFLSFNENDIESFIILCEGIVENITKDSETKYRLKSAIHELIVNSLEHGYNKSAGSVSISLKKSKDFIIFEISDKGDGVDLSSIDLNKTVSDLENLSSRGWGLAITNKLSDDMKITKNGPTGTKISLKFYT
jgi:anti-sigma regulatory factor (Ser/Thr protein kinase)